MKKTTHTNEPDRNEDPITGAPGAHPVGVGAGAALGGAAAGAAAGAVAGPAGAVVGAVVGGVAGGYAGKAAAEAIDPTEEDAYWKENHAKREYYDKNFTYDDYGPAYRYGWESRTRYAEREYTDVEPALERDWQTARTNSRLPWPKAKSAVRDAWQRAERRRAAK
jgi:phage tail tape-measure protein